MSDETKPQAPALELIIQEITDDKAKTLGICRNGERFLAEGSSSEAELTQAVAELEKMCKPLVKPEDDLLQSVDRAMFKSLSEYQVSGGTLYGIREYNVAVICEGVPDIYYSPVPMRGAEILLNDRNLTNFLGYITPETPGVCAAHKKNLGIE